MCTAVCPDGTAINSNGDDAADASFKTSCTYCLKGYFVPSGGFTPGTTACNACTTSSLSS